MDLLHDITPTRADFIQDLPKVYADLHLAYLIDKPREITHALDALPELRYDV
jgi:hypothetical protein